MSRPLPFARPGRFACATSLSMALLAACGSEGANEPVINPLPVLTNVTPAQIVAGSGVTSITVTGSGFVASSQVRWNNGDRVTHFQGAQSLTADLLPSDVAGLTTAKITVVNGAPGGGTSGDFTVVVGYPSPQVTAVTPNTTAIRAEGAGPLTLVITGSGFVPQSVVRLGNAFIATTAVTATQITANVDYFYLGSPGTLKLTVTNPTPGGGASNAVDFGVTYPQPSITTVSPDSSLTGATSPVTLTVNGTGFTAGSVVRWNGADRPTTLLSETRITAVLPASDLSTASVATITVFNPTPGGGTSNSVSHRVRQAAPLIDGISPGAISAGAGPTIVTISGTNFLAGATAQWNGQGRTATVGSATSMTMTLLASDVAATGVGQVTVTNPGPSGVSNAVTLAVVTPSASLAIVKTIALVHADLAWDPVRSVLYASIPDTASQNPNSVVRLNPATGAVTGVVSVGSNPGILEITEDGQFLYVALRGAPRIARIALATFTKDIDISIPGDGFFGNAYAEDMVAIPGAPRTIAVSTFYTGIIPRNAGTVMFDDGIMRPARGPGHTGSNRITRGPTNVRIYGYNNETTEFGVRSLIVGPNGLQEETVRGGAINGFSADIEYGGGYLYATSGEVIAVTNLQKAGTIPAGGIVRPDAANGRVHFLSASTISTFHYTSFAGIGAYADIALSGHAKLIRWETDGLAVGGGSTIVLLRGGLVR